MDSHSSGPSITRGFKRPYPSSTRTALYPIKKIEQNSYLVLLQAGFTLPLLLPTTRCALTAPFHPYRKNRRYIFCGTFRRLSSPRRYLALCPMEPGLSSMNFHSQRLSSWLSAQYITGAQRCPQKIELSTTNR